MSLYREKKKPYVKWVVAIIILGILVFVGVTDFHPTVVHVEKTMPYMAP